MIKVLKTNKYILILLIAMLILGVKAFWGFGWDDEGYYLSIVHRFYMGEIPMFDEWYPSQLSGVLLLPVYSLYKMMNNSGTGIVLFFRLFYLFMLFVNSMLVYFIVKKYAKKEIVAFFAAAFLLIYSTENKALYSYSDLAVSFLIFSLLLILVEETLCSNSKAIYFGAGLSFVCAIFANPYLIVIYVYLIVLTLIKWKKKKDNRSIVNLLLFTAGCCLLGFAFIGYLLCHASVKDLIECFMYFVNFPGHAAKNIFVDIVKWCWYVVKPYSLPLIGVQAVIFAYAILCQFTGKMKISKELLFGVELICAVLYILIQCFFMEDDYVIGIAYIPLAVLGFLCFVLIKGRDWKMFLIVYVPGILMSVAYQCSSDTGIFAITTGFVVVSIAAVVLIYHFLCENSCATMRYGYIIFLSIVLSWTLCTRIIYCRYNEYEETYNCRMESGPYKGIVTDERQKKYYEDSLKEMEIMQNQMEEDDTVLILGNNMWMYMCLDRRVAAPTTWRMTVEHEYFEPYFDMHIGKMPRFIYANESSEVYNHNSLILVGEVYTCIYEGRGKIYSK